MVQDLLTKKWIVDKKDRQLRYLIEIVVSLLQCLAL
jgi:hypothetical protein